MADQVDRRQFIQRAGVASAAVAGTAWVAPVVLDTNTAWAVGSCPAPTMGLGTTTGANGWVLTAAGMVSNTAGAGNSGNGGWLGVTQYPTTGTTNRMTVERDPITSALAGAIVTYDLAVALTSGNHYVFSYSTYVRNVNQYTQHLAVQVGTGGTGASFVLSSTLATYATQTTAGQTLLGPDQAVQTFTSTFVAPSTGTFIFRYRFTFGTENENSANGVADDIGVTGPTVTCSLT